MDISQAIYARRSVRKFTADAVQREQLEELVRLGAAAPSATNRKPWVFIAVDEPQQLKRLKDRLPLGRYNAPAAILVCADMRRTHPLAREFWIQDCAAALQNILLGAVGMGLGGVWVGIHPVGLFIRGIKKAFGLPEHIAPLGVALLGHPVDVPPARTQWEPSMLLWQRYSQSVGDDEPPAQMGGE
ncbi:MAG: nitroreductase family protein [Eubacteriales bacterium]|nr:nitroreductase family protein [Eubacteriales bacterium]